MAGRQASQSIRLALTVRRGALLLLLLLLLPLLRIQQLLSYDKPRPPLAAGAGAAGHGHRGNARVGGKGAGQGQKGTTAVLAERVPGFTYLDLALVVSALLHSLPPFFLLPSSFLSSSEREREKAPSVSLRGAWGVGEEPSRAEEEEEKVLEGTRLPLC